MAKPNTTDLFVRAEACGRSGDSAICATLDRELAALEQVERPEWARTQPPGATIVYDGAGRAHEQRTPPGPDWQAAADAGDTERAAALAERWRVLDHRQDRIAELRAALAKRAKVATEQERRARAPGEAKQLVRELGPALDRVEQAAAAYDAARSAVEAIRSRLVEARELAGDDAPALDFVTFRRLGLALAHRLERRIVPTYDPMGGGERAEPHLFISPSQAQQMEYALVAGPTPGLLEWVRRKMTSYEATDPRLGNKDVAPHELASELRDFHRERLRLITQGELKEAERLEPTPPGYRGPRWAPRATDDEPRGITGGRQGAAVRRAIDGGE